MTQEEPKKSSGCGTLIVVAVIVFFVSQFISGLGPDAGETQTASQDHAPVESAPLPTIPPTTPSGAGRVPRHDILAYRSQSIP